MKILVVARDAQIRDALEYRLKLRDRPYQCVADGAWLDTAPADQSGAISLVVNAHSLESLQQDDDQGLTDSLSQLVKACEQRSLPLIHLSGSQVFDGLDGGRHREDDEWLPASKAGVILSAMETAVRDGCQRHIIIRTGPVFSAVGSNLFTDLVANIVSGTTPGMSSTGKACPVHAGDLARVISAIIDQLACNADCWGTYHYCSSDPATRYQFAETVLAVASQYLSPSAGPLQLQPDADVETDWPRPLMHCEKVLNNFGIKQLSWRSYIVATVKELLQPVAGEKVNEF